MTVIATYRPFGEIMPRTFSVAGHPTLAELARQVVDLPAGWPRHEHDQIHINGKPVPQGAWHLIRPRPKSGVPVEVTFHAPPMGGGDGGGKQVFALVASIALTAGVGFISNGGLASVLGEKFAEGTIGANLAAAGGALAGSLALSALAPPPLAGASGVQQDASGTGGNVLEPNTAPPRVVGTRRVTPPLLAQPFVTREGPDEVVHAIYGLAGPHAWSDVRVNGTSAGDVERLDYEVREGWAGDAQIELVTQIGAMETPRAELRGYLANKNGEKVESPTGNIADALPQPLTVRTASGADVVEIHLNLPSGLNIAGDLGKLLRVPFRVRLRDQSLRREDRPDFAADDPALAGYVVPALDRVRSAVIVADVDFGQAPSGTIARLGSVAHGAYLGIAGDELHFTWGETGSRGVLSIPANRLRGRRGVVVAEIDVNERGARLWWRDFGSVEMTLIASGPFGGEAVQWCDDGAGGVGDDWAGTVHALRIAHGQILPSDWIDLPELHFQAATTDQMRPTIRLRWSADVPAAAVADDEGFAEARVYAPVAPGGGEWGADPYFDAGGAVLPAYLDVQTIGYSRVRNVVMDRDAADIYLDPAHFPRGRYEVEITRGALLRGGDDSNSFDPATYATNGRVFELFGAPVGGNKLPHPQKNRTDTVYVDRVVSIKDQHPLPKGGFAVVAMRGRNIQIDEMSALASGYVRDWDGSGWNFWTITSNPAPHLVDVFFGEQSARPLPRALFTDEANAEFVAWRSDCAAKGLTCDVVLSQKSFAAVSELVAASGYARPYLADIAAIARDRDRSGDGPVQVFTPRNSSGFRFTKSFEVIPDGFLVSFVDRTQDYQPRQVLVPADASGLIEQVEYEGPTTEQQVTDRAMFDLKQARLRSTRYALEAPAEAIVCRRGSLIAVQHDVLTDRAGAARLIDWELNDLGRVTALHLDASVPVRSEAGFEGAADVSAIDDVTDSGARTGVVIRRTDGTRTVHEITGQGDLSRLELAAPVDRTGIDQGCLVVVGALGSEMMRGLVTGISYAEGLTHTINFVDEAQELFE